MRKKLLETATALSETFMPAERAQSSAALGAAESLVLALKLADHPGFRKANVGPAKEALALGVLHSVKADEALREAHGLFAQLLPQAPMMDGWGCTSPNCNQRVSADLHVLSVHDRHVA